MLQNIRRRHLIWLVGAFSLAGVVVIVVGMLIVQHANQANAQPPETELQSLPTPSHIIPYQDITGLKQYELAHTAALNWSTDAALINASSRWPNLLSISKVGEPNDWSYHFYSPKLKRKLFVTVTSDSQVQIFQHPIPVSLAPDTFAINEPLIDSPVALATWLDHGGKSMLQNNPGLELIIQLRADRTLSTPAWLVVGLNSNSDTNYAQSVLIRATDGRVLP
ncbi:hypothetical protein QUF64_10845 [Anaerolineales bacterium HSG6]|nr:hypothetical protein [Anaerolineales bacterium HSG6]MDM8530374.1 hypothetical protein [Anaerolineales bacterium HSG25]